MYNYHKTHHKSSYICECENRSLLRKGSPEGQKSVLTELDWARPRQSSETAALGRGGFRSLGNARLGNRSRDLLSPAQAGRNCSSYLLADDVPLIASELSCYLS